MLTHEDEVQKEYLQETLKSDKLLEGLLEELNDEHDTSGNLRD
jgi:hypothetical protein